MNSKKTKKLLRRESAKLRAAETVCLLIAGGTFGYVVWSSIAKPQTKLLRINAQGNTKRAPAKIYAEQPKP